MMTHRLAGANDFDSVYELYMEPSANPYLTYDPMERKDFRGTYKNLLKTETLYVVEMEGAIIATYRLIPKTDRQAHTVYLGGFSIKKDLQGRGIGSQVINHIKAFVLEQQKSRIELTVDVNNGAAIALYKKSGFLIEGQLRNSYKRSDSNQFYDEYLMGVIL